MPGDGGRWRLYLTLHCHHQNDSCIKMPGQLDESRFNVSLIVMDKVTRQCPQTTTFEEEGEPKRNRTEVLLLTSLTLYRWAKPAHGYIRAIIKETPDIILIVCYKLPAI